MESVTSLQKRFCNRWSMYDECRKPEPFYFIYGIYSKGGELCGRGDEEKKFMTKDGRRFADYFLSREPGRIPKRMTQNN
jgi:hypothetical protein